MSSVCIDRSSRGVRECWGRLSLLFLSSVSVLATFLQMSDVSVRLSVARGASAPCAAWRVSDLQSLVSSRTDKRLYSSAPALLASVCMRVLMYVRGGGWGEGHVRIHACVCMWVYGVCVV